ncbi:hypothetical protein EI94DRAFT_1701506 [Lactarius quietus]|nr:hypothetical protein EI94DRAFT_1701506 [Lactarius quietus]
MFSIPLFLPSAFFGCTVNHDCAAQTLLNCATCDAIKSASAWYPMDRVIRDSTPKKECDHPNIAFWHKKAFLLERMRCRASKKLQRHYPLSRLCNNHYKAKVFAHEDYTHWFKEKYPPSKDTKPDSPLKHSHSNSHAVLHMALQCSHVSSKNGHDNMEVDDNGQQWVDWEGIDNEDDNNAIFNNNPEGIIPLATGHALTTPLELFATTTAPMAPISTSDAAHGRPTHARSV